MSDHGCPLRPVLVGNRRFPRYAIVVDGSPSLPTLDWAGRSEGPWTAEVSVAMKWANPDTVTSVILGMRTAEPTDLFGARRWANDWWGA